MDAKQAVQIIRDDLAKLKNDAFESVTIDSLESVLRRIDELSDLSGKELAREIEHYKAVSAASLAEYDAERSLHLEMFRSVISYGQSALKSATLINGGGAVALLAFIGHVWSSQLSRVMVTGLGFSLLLFVLGVLCASVASGTTYLSQGFYHEAHERLGKTIHAITILLVIGSYVFFAFGAYNAYLTFLLNVA